MNWGRGGFNPQPPTIPTLMSALSYYRISYHTRLVFITYSRPLMICVLSENVAVIRMINKKLALSQRHGYGTGTYGYSYKASCARTG